MPMVTTSLEHDRTAMASRDPTHEVYDAACDLLQAARAIEQAAASDGVLEAIPATLGTIEETLQVLSASFYRLAGGCAASAPCNGPQRSRDPDATVQPLSRENKAFLMATLHDVGSSIARASRASRAGREITAPLIARKLGGSDSSEPRTLRWPRARHGPSSSEQHLAPRA